MRKAFAGMRHFAVRRVALPLLARRPARRGALMLARWRFRIGGRPGRVIDHVLTATAPDLEERIDSVQAVVELFFDLCSLTDVDVFVEAGAKEASASQRAVEAGIAQVVAFEANPYTYRHFAAGIAAAGVDYRHLALSETGGDTVFLVRRREDGSPIPDGQGSLLVRPDHEPGYEEVTVRAVLLDDEIDGDGRVAMWVDVEGAVAEVFGGATSVLARTDVLIVEVEAVERWVGQRWMSGDVVDQLASTGLRAVARDMQSRLQYNIVFVREELLADGQMDTRISTWRHGSSSNG
jgi:FkbM family methyltransferase